ncbi:MAG: hypothetical protein E7346_00745 [Clostridiales bacterium]|nr:hypothetical protein [Clostridiales bacterium]
MKLTRKIKAIIVMAVIAIISITCVACGGGSSVEFKYKKDVPTTALYGTELYFKDYLPREYGQEYKLYATYHDNENDKDVTEQLHDSLVFKFENVGEHKFKIVRGEEDTLECTVNCMPEVPRFIEKGISSKKLGYKIDLSDMVFEAFGSNPLENKAMVECDPSYNIELTQVDIYSVEVDGTDQLNYDFKNKNQLVLDKDASYTFTFKATTVAGSATTQVTFSTSDTTAHSTTLNGYVLEEDLDDNKKGLYFTIPGMTAPANGESVKVRFGPTADKNIYSAVYNEYTGKYFVADFAHKIAKGKEERLYVKETGTDGKNFSTYIANADIIKQENADTLSKKSDGYVLLGDDIEFATKGIYVDWTSDDKNVFSGTLDGNGHTIKNLEGTPIVNASGTRTAKGTSLFSQIDGAIIRNVAFEDVVGTSGIIVARTEGENLIENVVIKAKGYTGAYSSIIGFHVDSQLSTTIRNVVYNSAIDNSELSYKGMISTHAGGSCIVDNFIIIGGNDRLHANNGQHATYIPNHVNKDYDEVVKDRDYFRYNTAEEYAISGGKEKVSDFVNDMLDNVNLVVALDHTNIQRLSGATNGYYYLTEDINMNGGSIVYPVYEKVTSANAQQFTGVLDGKGYEISNFTAQNGYFGLFQWTGNGATIKNLDIHATTNTTKGAIIGQVRGATLIQNVNVTLDEMKGATHSSVICSVLQGQLTLKDVNVLLKLGVAGGTNGILCGSESSTVPTILDNVTAIDASGKLANVCTTQGSTITGTEERYDVTPLGVDGEVAVDGEDYILYNGINAVGEAILAETMNAEAESMVKEENLYVELSASNISDLLTATAGYYVLTENVDMKNVDINGDKTIDSNDVWAPADATVFTGILNGCDHNIKNFTPCGTNWIGFFARGNGAIVKNISIDFLNTGTRAGVFGRSQGSGVHFDNVNLTFATASSYSGVALAGIASAPIEAKNSKIIFYAKTNTSPYLVTNESGAANGQTIVSNVTVIDLSASNKDLAPEFSSHSKPNAMGLYGTDRELAVAGEDYTLVSKTPLDLYKAKADNQLDKAVLDLIVEFNLLSSITELTEENFALLQTATSRNYILKEDIDMTKVDCNGSAEGLGTWTPSATFTGTFDGNGKKITNFTAPSGYAGLFQYVNGATIKNLDLHAKTNTSKGVLIGQVKGATLIQNVNVVVDKLESPVDSKGNKVLYASAISSVLQGTLTLKDVNVLVKDVDSALSGNSGIIATGEAGTKSMILDNVTAIDASGKLSTVCPNIGAVIKSGEPDRYDITPLGTDGKAAVDGEDFVLVKDIIDLNPEAFSSELFKSEVKAIRDMAYNAAIKITKANIVEMLQDATSGYYILTEDIDMTGISFAPSDATVFTGTLNGNGKKITNFTPCGANYVGLFARGDGATIKNLTIHYTKSATRAGLFGRVQGAGTTVVENCNIIVDVLNTYYGTTIANAMSAQLIVRDTLVYIKDSSSADVNNSGALGSKEASTKKMIVDNVVIVDAKGKFTKLIPDANSTYDLIPVGVGGSNAVNGTDYFLYSSVEAVETARQGKTLPDGFETRLIDAGVLTAASNG